LHRVHHSDTQMDVTTAFRFHPFEIVASLVYKAAWVIILGAPAGAVFAFEMALGAGAMLTHANVGVPTWLERVLRSLFITPALHLIHHSPNPIETNSNYGFSFSFWDRLFGTFRAASLITEPRLGLEKWRDPVEQKLPALLRNPFE
jgi:sterol desaturase/sphingolipid hydroxylase (fatty acid hydroxylase superfamily)